jgi:hypothetical protein
MVVQLPQPGNRLSAGAAFGCLQKPAGNGVRHQKENVTGFPAPIQLGHFVLKNPAVALWQAANQKWKVVKLA